MSEPEKVLRPSLNTMCRSFVPQYIENGKEKATARFNLGVTTISLPYVALLAKGDKELVFAELDKAAELAYEANMFRIKRMKGTKAKVSPILWMYGGLATLGAEDTIDHLFYNGNATCSIGYAGLNELLEVCNDTSREFAVEVMTRLKNKIDEFTERSNIKFSGYGSPVESGCLRLASAIKRDFPEYGFDRDFITNSFHLPVFADVDIEEKFEWESDFYMLSSGGNVNNVELPSMQKNLKGMEGVIHMAYDKVNYLIVNQPIDECYECDFSGEFESTEWGYKCPTCGNNNPETASCIRRVSGYVHDALARPANEGKFAEQRVRTKHI